MKISEGFRAWLLKGHPDRPDFGGYDQQRREEFVRRVEGTDPSKLEEAANRPLALVESLRTAGGPGSGNFGHAGRPGQVGGSSKNIKRGWHLTSDRVFQSDPTFQPEWNSLAGDLIGDKRPAGLFVGDPEYWMHAHGYERPYVAEVEGDVTNPPGSIMYKGREEFMQGDIKTIRVLPIDEYAREHYGETGWVEDYFGANRRKMTKGYIGRSVAEMSQQEIEDWERRFEEYAERKDGPRARQQRILAKKNSILAAADKYVPKFSVTFRYAFAKGRQVMRRTRDEDQAIRAITRALETVLPNTLKQAFIEGGEVGAQLLNQRRLKTAAKKKKTIDNDDVEVSFAFSEVHPRIAEWAEEHAAELITDITETSRKRIRNAVSDLIEEGDWELATDRIMAAVGDVERAELIAHHETMLAVSEGQREIWRQAEEDGLLDETAQRTWIVTPDEKLCPICEALDGTVADLNGEYPGGYEGPPAHVSCRCTEGITTFRAGGGAGSGNFGHAGRPGQVGGSASATAAVSDHEMFRRQKVAVHEQLLKEIHTMRDQLAKENVEVVDKGGWESLDPEQQEGRWNIAALHTGVTSLLDARQALRNVGVEPPTFQIGLSTEDLSRYASAEMLREADDLGPAMYRININQRNYAWQNGYSLQRRTSEDSRAFFHPNHRPSSVMIHEMGHVLHGSQIKRLGKPIDVNLGREVSRYAETNDLEFVAETFTGLVAGRKYSKHVMDEYAKLGGPPVPGKKAS